MNRWWSTHLGKLAISFLPTIFEFWENWLMWHSFNGSEHGSYGLGMAVFIDQGLLVPVFCV
jgi:hypothetical protein